MQTKGVMRQHASEKGSWKVLKTAVEKALKTIPRRCRTIIFRGRRVLRFLEGVLRRSL